MSIKDAVEKFENGWKWGAAGSRRWAEVAYQLVTAQSLDGVKTAHLLDILSRLKHSSPTSPSIQKIEKELAKRANPTKLEMNTSLLFTKALSKDPKLLEHVNASNIKLSYLLNNPSILKKMEITSYFTEEEIKKMPYGDMKKLIPMLARMQGGDVHIEKFLTLKGESVHPYLQRVLPEALHERIKSLPKPALFTRTLDLDRHLTPLERKYLTHEHMKIVIEELIPWGRQGIDAIKTIIGEVINGEDNVKILYSIALSAVLPEIQKAPYGQEFIHLVAIPLLNDNKEKLTPKSIDQALRIQVFINAPLSSLLTKKDMETIFKNTDWKENTAATLSKAVEAQEQLALARVAEKIKEARSPFYISDFLKGRQMKSLNVHELNTLIPLIGAKKDGLEALMTLHEHQKDKKVMENALLNAAVEIVFKDRFRADFQLMANLATALKKIHPGNYPLYIFENLVEYPDPFADLPFFLEAAGLKWDAYIDFVEKVPFKKIPENKQKKHLKALHELYSKNLLKNPDEATMRVVEFSLDSLIRRNKNDLIDIDPPGRKWIITALASENPKVREKGVELVKKAIKGVDVSPGILTNIFKRPMNILIELSDLGELAGKNRGSLLSQVKERDDIEDKVATYCSNYPFALSTLFTEEGLKLLTPQQAGRLILAASTKRGGSAEIFKIYEAADEIDKKPLEESLIRFYLENLKPNRENPDREVIFRNMLTVLQKIYGKDFDTALLDRLYDMSPKEDPFKLLCYFHQDAADNFIDPNEFLKTARLDKTPQRLLNMHLEKLWTVYGGKPPNKALNQVLDFSLRQDIKDLFPPGANWVKEALKSEDRSVHRKAIELITRIYNPNDEPDVPIPSELIQALGFLPLEANWNQLDQVLTALLSGKER